MNRSTEAGVFLCRDGTIIKDRGYLRDMSDVVFFTETFKALRKLNEYFLLFIVTNQTGIAEPVNVMLIVAGSRDERNYHLRGFMVIAQITQEKDFESRWFEARDTEAIRKLILLSTRRIDTQSWFH